MMRTLRRIPLLAGLLILVACGSGTGRPEVGDPRPRRDPSRITRVELMDTHAVDAYEAIRILRPSWLRPRGQTSVLARSTVMVYIDNVQVGGPDVLRGVPLTTVTTMEYVDPSSATQRWGTNHVHGAIVVTTVRS